MWLNIKKFLLKYESKIILVFGLVLVAILSFEAGVLKSVKISQNPIIIEKKTLTECQKPNSDIQEALNLPQKSQNNTESINNLPQNCAFIGSKNSNKYHVPTCRWAKNIKPENITCFKDKNEAESKGYLPDKNCIK